MSVAAAQLEKHQLAADIKQRARAIGFDLVGITSAEPSRRRDYLRRWLDEGQHGEMQYLASRFDERTDPTVYVSGAKSVICVAINYHAKLQPVPDQEGEQHGRIARYALGDDYHELIKKRLYKLADAIRQIEPTAITRCSVDTAPVMEKELAARAGIGWMGKHTCIINRSIGSWLLLGEIITSLELPGDDEAIDHCGTCRRCIDACPTGAITQPYQLDARRCISYLTIEQRTEISPDLRDKLGDWIFGCDICQEVCPWNREAPVTNDPQLQPRFPTGTIDVRQLLEWRAGEPNPVLSGSAIKRVKLPVLQRNARAIKPSRNQ
jgi:epoxyqueuosine reductase